MSASPNTPGAGPQGTTLQVTRRDGRIEQVLVRKLGHNEFPEWSRLIAIGDERAQCAFFTGKQEVWVSDLADESMDDVLDAGQDLNLEGLARWNTRQQRAFAQLARSNPGLVRHAMLLAQAELSANPKAQPKN